MGVPNVFAELVRRNVLRAGALYLGAVWALAQGIAQLGPEIGAPSGLTRWFLIAAVIGLPLFLAFAWFYEFTPEGLKRESEIAPGQSISTHTGRKLDFAIIGVLAIAVVLLLADRLVLRHGLNQTAAAVPEASIAVLPFLSRSEDRSQDYFADGISEDMLSLLARVPKLKVISRSSSFSFKGKDMALKDIAATLGVAYILEGSVQRAGKTLRISAQLVDARGDHTVWTQTWDRTLEDVFKIQDEVAGAVVRQLKLQLLGKAQEIDPSGASRARGDVADRRLADHLSRTGTPGGCRCGAGRDDRQIREGLALRNCRGHGRARRGGPRVRLAGEGTGLPGCRPVWHRHPCSTISGKTRAGCRCCASWARRRSNSPGSNSGSLCRTAPRRRWRKRSSGTR